MRSPCASCEHLAQDKNAPGCMTCRARIDYVTGLGSMAFSVPIEETDMAGKPFSDEEDMEIIRSMREPATKVAERLGRAVASIYSRRSQLRAMGREVVVPAPPSAPPKGPPPPPPPNPRRRNGHTKPIRNTISEIISTQMVIDLGDHPDVYKAIEDRAAIELRTINDQAVWMLKCALQGSARDNRRASDGASRDC